MPLPAFTANGLLPDGIHPSNESDLKERCVDHFPSSLTRPNVLAGFSRYRHDISKLGLNLTQWIDGSFTDETRIDPEDVDLVNFPLATELNTMSPPDRTVAGMLLGAGRATTAGYSCHTFLEIVFPPGHPYETAFEQRRLYWRHWFSTPQDYSNPPSKVPAPHRGRKGIVEMTVGDSAAAPAINPNL